MNGLPCEFYKAMQDTIGNIFSYLASKFLTIGQPLEFLHQGMIKLILKNVMRDFIGQW